MDFLVGNALNFRLGTKKLSLPEIVVEADKQGYTIKELFAVVEEDKWVYPDGI